MDSAITVPCIEHAALDNWNDRLATFASAPSWELHQAWHDKPEELFRPAFVRVAWRRDALLLLADLDDDLIVDAREPFNTMAFINNDTWEIFLRPSGQSSYFEFHITPHGSLLQLRFPCAGYLSVNSIKWHDQDPLAAIRIDRPHLVTDTMIRPGGWRAYAEIPFTLVCENTPTKAGDELLFSFSRYDHHGGNNEPTLSSTSRHSQPNFHCEKEWKTLRLG